LTTHVDVNNDILRWFTSWIVHVRGEKQTCFKPWSSHYNVFSKLKLIFTVNNRTVYATSETVHIILARMYSWPYLSGNQGRILATAHWVHLAGPTSAPQTCCLFHPSLNSEPDPVLKNIYLDLYIGQNQLRKKMHLSRQTGRTLHLLYSTIHSLLKIWVVHFKQCDCCQRFKSKQEQRKCGIIRPSIVVKNNRSIPLFIPLKSELEL
jgi:hypothetical protein